QHGPAVARREPGLTPRAGRVRRRDPVDRRARLFENGRPEDVHGPRLARELGDGRKNGKTEGDCVQHDLVPTLDGSCQNERPAEPLPEARAPIAKSRAFADGRPATRRPTAVTPPST